MAASFHVLHEGYNDDRGTTATVSLVLDGEAVIVVDPGMVADREDIIGPLRALGHAPEDVTHVFLTHHHPDHTVNAALFPRAKIHDHWATYDGDLWISRQAEGFQLAPDVWLLRTPGHTEEDISTLARTDEGVVAFTHAWWRADGPADDPYAPDRAVLSASRERTRGGR